MKNKTIEDQKRLLIEDVRKAIQAGDDISLKKLKEQVKSNTFLSQYIDEDGTGNVPPEAWLALQEGGEGI